jgi:hypothetical protein
MQVILMVMPPESGKDEEDRFVDRLKNARNFGGQSTLCKRYFDQR